MKELGNRIRSWGTCKGGHQREGLPDHGGCRHSTGSVGGGGGGGGLKPSFPASAQNYLHWESLRHRHKFLNALAVLMLCIQCDGAPKPDPTAQLILILILS